MAMAGQGLNAGSQNFMSFGGGSRLRAGAEFSKLQVESDQGRGNHQTPSSYLSKNGFHIQILEKNI
ncbi:hypothetical protein NC652_013156 [Populus alba x Populus x berolinensis]|nr:hypothetical protein NC652_013156 [Populus alba x Populus x berolinensis]